MIYPPESFLTHSLKEKPWGMKAARIISASLTAVEPGRVIKESLVRTGTRLRIGDEELNLKDFNRIFLIGIGKASTPMTLAAADILNEHLHGGMILTKSGSHDLPERVTKILDLYYGGHPIPDQNSLKAVAAITNLLSKAKSDDLILFLLSGGGSALLAGPYPGLTLKDLRLTNQILLSCGADIKEINTIRKHISTVKGGQLAKIAVPAKLFTLILSDVMGNQLDMIASGPTTPDPSTYQDAVEIIERYDLDHRLPKSVLNHLIQGLAGHLPETPKPGDPIFRDVTNLIIGRNSDSIQAGVQQAVLEGFNADTLPEPLEGEARLAGEKLAAILQRMALKSEPLPRPACLIIGGETTVSLQSSGEIGKGGRNIEIALSAVKTMNNVPGVVLITLATDGEDGETDAAGAVVTGDSLRRGRILQMDPETYLRNHNSYPYFQALNDLLVPGVTQTNVNDLCFLITF